MRHQVVEVRPAGAAAGVAYDGLVHRHRGQCLLELERAPAQPVDGLQVHADVGASLRSATDLEDLLTRLAQQVKRVTALDRVMVYRFDADWHGEVVAQAREPEMEPFLGLHYPASDIPAQARELYRTNLVRYIADVGYVPVPVQPGADPVNGEPLDMSHSVLRSVFPMHLQYLQNMGVGSTLTISIVVEGQLWGLVAAHHRRPTALPLRLRQVCGALAVGASYRVGWQLQKHRVDAGQRAAQIQQRVAEVFNQAEVPLADAVEHAAASLLQLVGASAGVLWHRGEAVSFGRWPGGALIARLGDFSDSGLMWLRPEFRREPSWGGDPDKPATLALDAQGRSLLSPRASSERWTTLVRGPCRPWSELDLEAARAMLPLRQMLAVRDSLADALQIDRRFRGLLDLQPVALATCIEQALPTLRVQADAAAAQLRLDAPGAAVWVHADAAGLGPVLLILVSHAIQYNDAGGTVTVTLAQPAPGRASIAVEDTGAGLDASQRAQIFQPFHRLGHENQQTPGTGIGLVVARLLAEAVGGRIHVRSEPGLGSCFTLSPWPRAARATATTASPDRPSPRN